MIAKRKKNKRAPFFPSILFALLVFGSIALLIFFNLKIRKRRLELLSQIENLEKEITILKEKSAELKAGLSQTTKESYWEEKAREQGFVKEGENQVVVVPPQEESSQEEPEEKFWNPQSWWEQIMSGWGWLKRKLED
jgi:cell division protein FtsB